MTSAVDERGSVAEIPGSADDVARVVPQHVLLEHRSGLPACD
jgi:hypothetical protein